ncbi:MAG: flagellar hook-associated protein FlgL [Chromatiales bacterium]|jgi:flagellar hook-associated protein 3 FlgL|nr:flagellar hook-associated protein FlgL [Chromatiales bacterium]
MRISTNQIFRDGVDTILTQQSRLARTQAQLGSGQRILSPADDPAGAAAALRITERIGLTDQYQDNIRYARGRLAQEEGVLSASLNALQRVRELAIAANNGVLQGDSRRAIASDVQQRIREMLNVANSRDPDGEYLFSGFKGRTVPFTQAPSGAVTYAGDQGQRSVQVGTDQRVALADSGHDAFVAIRTGNGTFSVADNATNTGSGVIDPGIVSDASAYVADTYSIIMSADSGVAGGAIGLVDTGVNDTLTYELRINGVLVDTLNEGGTRNLTQLESAINGTSGATGVQAHVDAGRLLLSNTPAGNGIIINETLIGASEDTDTVTGFFGGALSGITTPSVSTDLGGAADAFVVLNSGGSIQTSGNYVEHATITFNGIQTAIHGGPEQGDTFTVAPSQNQDVFTTLTNLASALNSDGASLNNALNRAVINIDRAMDNLVIVRTEVGARQNSLDTQEDVNADFTVELKTTLSSLRDLDYTEAASRLNQQLLALQAAQQAFVRVQNLSLFNFLG